MTLDKRNEVSAELELAGGELVSEKQWRQSQQCNSFHWTAPSERKTTAAVRRRKRQNEFEGAERQASDADFSPTCDVAEVCVPWTD